MRYLAIAIFLFTGFILWGQVATKPGTPTGPAVPSNFELKSTTEIKNGIRPYAETTYVLNEKQRNGQVRERWRILQGDKYANHWISSSGMVWVLTEGMPGPGGSGRLWARDANADLKGTWGTWQIFQRPSGRMINSDVDIPATQAVSLPSGSEQLRLVFKDGSEVRITNALTQTDEFTLMRVFPPNSPKTDVFTDLLSQPGNRPVVEWPAPNRVPIAIWNFFGNGQPQYLSQTYDIGSNLNSNSNQIWRSEKLLKVKPAMVARTPGSKMLWVEFGPLWEQSTAKLDVLDYRGDLIQSVDLLKLGKFSNSEDARKNIAYRDILCYENGAIETLDSTNMYGGDGTETFVFSDRMGRKYQVGVKTANGKYSVTADASLNLGKVAKKEPVYPTANLVSELVDTSESGRFTATVKNYANKGEKQTQLTLTTKLKDPIEGVKEVEVWSKVIPGTPKSFRVSNSGRVFVYTVGTRKNINDSGKDQDFAILYSWEPSGRQLGGMDPVMWKWYANLDQARKLLDLKAMKMEQIGIEGQVEVEGIPIPTWPAEKLTFPLGDGTSKALYINEGFEGMPSIMSFAPLKRNKK